MKYYDYLVSYTFKAEGYLSQGNGTSCISREKKIKTFDDIESIRLLIAENLDNTPASSVCINNIIFIGRNKH